MLTTFVIVNNFKHDFRHYSYMLISNMIFFVGLSSWFGGAILMGFTKVITIGDLDHSWLTSHTKLTHRDMMERISLSRFSVLLTDYCGTKCKCAILAQG